MTWCIVREASGASGFFTVSRDDERGYMHLDLKRNRVTEHDRFHRCWRLDSPQAARILEAVGGGH